MVNQAETPCPCARLKCKRHGNCAECRKHHEGKKYPIYCERGKDGKERTI